MFEVGPGVSREKPDQSEVDYYKRIFVSAFGPPFRCLLFLDHPTLKTFLLMAIAIWSFCRFYYFGFYVLGCYVDSNYKFSGLISMMQYVVSRRKGQIEARQEGKT
jgi:hypothetical protein